MHEKHKTITLRQNAAKTAIEVQPHGAMEAEYALSCYSSVYYALYPDENPGGESAVKPHDSLPTWSHEPVIIIVD